MRLSTRLSGLMLLLISCASMVQAATNAPVAKPGGKSPPTIPAAPASTASTASTAAAAEPARNTEVEKAIFGFLEAGFRVPADLPVDADLRAAAQALSAAHLAKLKAELPAWVAQEQRSSSVPLGNNELQWRLYARFINEFALTRLESTGPDFDAAWLAGALKPRFCDLPPQLSFFAERTVMMQQVPKAQRAVVLEGERLLLQRWGTPRQGLPQPPSPSVDEQVASLIGSIKAGAARPAVAMPPVLANVHMNTSDAEPTDRWQQRCMSAQWWLRLQPLDGEADRARALNGFRYATLLLGSDMSRPPGKLPPDNATDYPRMAASFGVEGLLRLLLRIDSKGKLQRAEVIQRDVSVRGIRGNPPVAFDNLLDQAALAKAKATRFAAPAPEKIKNGIFTAEQEFQFTLDRDKPTED
jgi:hypothetical protein